jgi:glycosyltransferase involved in cell wall biosynthesis
MARPDVTFVVPNYNGARYLAETIDSLLAQRDPDFAVIVADNRSTDGSVEIARSYRDPRLSVIVGDTHVSMSENWNRCIDYVQSPYFVLAHSDDVYEPDYLSTMLPLLKGEAQAFMAHCRAFNIDQDGRVLDLPLEQFKLRFYPAQDPYCRTPCEEAAWLRQGNYFQAPAAIYRTDLVRRIGPFNTSVQFVPDWEYWLRGVLAGYRMPATRRQLIRYRRHPGSLSTAFEVDLRKYREEIALLEWLAGAGHAAGCFADARPDYGLVVNTLTSGVADRLARGDLGGALQLAAFARERVPGFRGSGRDRAIAIALRLGRAGGAMLTSGRQAYLKLLTWRHT